MHSTPCVYGNPPMHAYTYTYNVYIDVVLLVDQVVLNYTGFYTFHMKIEPRSNSKKIITATIIIIASAVAANQ